ncbi:MAG: DUF87 domain-containing protein [Chloroflexi bacterium]|nr:DUF87 domain-containing protein [Chloroflexota bacterium]
MSTTSEVQGSFYLGKLYDPEANQLLERPLEYDPRDLTTHGVILGMTGSGKTGLGISLLEEATLSGVPSIVIDPKGDVSNLLLAFPNLEPGDFLPWVNVDDARRRNMTVEGYAAFIAKAWREGLAQWGEGPERVAQYRGSADFTVYTPGSDAGMPVSVVQMLEAPPLSWDEEEETLRERIRGTVSALLGLVGMETDPVRSREHILLSNIFEHCWRKGEGLDIGKLVGYVQNPPITKLGVVDLDLFFPKADRLALALALNGIVAAPSFENWIVGMPLDIQQILYRNGQPRVSVFYIAHLSDQERMFFVSLLLQGVQAWLRGQSGTTSLRALLYFDELYGYMPPYPANPPSKVPLLTLLKQARAYGLGVVLATQNPVDLDYKALTNAGTWFVGKLQTDRDKARVLEGLEGAAAEAGGALDRAYFDRVIASLQNRVFLMHNVHAGRPQVFMTRWALSYLRGPLTREQIRSLKKMPSAAAATITPIPHPLSPTPYPLTPSSATPYAKVPPQLPSSLSILYLEPRVFPEGYCDNLRRETPFPVKLLESHLVYRPHLYGAAKVDFKSRVPDLFHTGSVSRAISASEDDRIFDWGNESLKVDPQVLSYQPRPEGVFAEVSEEVKAAVGVRRLQDGFRGYLERSQVLTLLYNARLEMYSEVGEAKEDFLARLQARARELSDGEAEKVRSRYQTQLVRLQDKLERAQRDLADKQALWDAKKRESTISIVESGFSLLLGKRPTRAVSTAASKQRMADQARMAVEERQAEVENLKEQIARLTEERDDAVVKIQDKYQEGITELEEKRFRPSQAAIRLETFALVWAPTWEIAVDVGGERKEYRFAGYED